MNSLQTTIIIVLSEITIALLAAAGAVIFRYLRQQARDQRGRAALILKLNAERDERRAALAQLLGETLGCDADQAETAARELMQAETTLYRDLLEIYTGRAGEALGDLDQKVRAVLGPYGDLLRRAAAVPRAGHSDDAQTGPLQERLAQLEGENRRLAAELEAAKKEMSSTLNEYASAFGGGHEGAEHMLEDPDGAPPAAAEPRAAARPPDKNSDPQGIDSILEDLDLSDLDLKLDDEAKGDQPVERPGKAAGAK